MDRYLKCECCGLVLIDETGGGVIVCPECIKSGCKDYSFVEISEEVARERVDKHSRDEAEEMFKYKVSVLLGHYREKYDADGDIFLYVFSSELNAVSQTPISYMITFLEKLIDECGDILIIVMVNNSEGTLEYIPLFGTEDE